MRFSLRKKKIIMAYVTKLWKFRCTKNWMSEFVMCLMLRCCIQWVFTAILQVLQSLELHKYKTELLIGFLCLRCRNWALIWWMYKLISLWFFCCCLFRLAWNHWDNCWLCYNFILKSTNCLMFVYASLASCTFQS